MSEEQTPTRALEGKSTNAKLAAAVIGGYVLGRTKKGRAAFKLASRLSGNQADPQAMSVAWTGVSQVAPSVQAAQIVQALGEVGGTAVKGTAETVSDTTRMAGGGVEGTAEMVSDTTKRAGGGVKGAFGKVAGRKKGKAEEAKPEEESDEGEEEGVGRGTSTD